MLTHPNFPTDLSDAEEDAGFKMMQIENPNNGASVAASQFYTVVAYEIRDTDNVVKSNNPFSNSACYKHVRYGKLKSNERYAGRPPHGQPVGNTAYSVR